jgi:polar amino acid transport system substrate-binding protein
VFVDNLASVSFLIRHHGLANLKISGQLPFSFDLAMGVRNDDPMLKAIIQKGLDSITTEEHNRIYQKWISLTYETRVDFSKVAPVILVLLIFITLISIYTLRLRKLHRQLREVNQSLSCAEEKLLQQNKELEMLSMTDKLTGIYNRHKLDSSLQQMVALAHRYDRVVSIIIFDLDWFKRVNDDYGHQAGDEVLICFADLVMRNIRKTDIFGRWGGEEFLIICPESNAEQAAELAEKIRGLVAECSCDPAFTQTVSAGVAQVMPNQTLDQLISLADKRLYQAKTAGRNQVFSS